MAGCLCLVCGIRTGRAEDIKRLIFEKQQITGKLRRPQTVLIESDPRPDFSSMRMSGDGMGDAVSIDRSLIEQSPYEGPFVIKNDRIVDIRP